MKDSTRDNMVNGSIWIRGLHMVIFAIAYNVIEFALSLTAIFQFFSVLITGKVNEPLLRFSKNGSIYIQEVLEFVTFNSEIRPFPFTSWPDEDHTGDVWLEDDDSYEEFDSEDRNDSPVQATNHDHLNADEEAKRHDSSQHEEDPRPNDK